MAPGMSWDAGADRKLLLGILKMQNVSVDFDAMAEYMTTDDQKCTASAIQNRVKKLKAMAKEGPAGNDEGTPKPKATPRKRAQDGEDADTPSKKTKTTKGRKGKTTEAGDGDDEEVGEEAVVKDEVVDEED
ncbi:hypothetical protein LTR08_004383 [Meristemomyces frigidus]|nr:hypothetical protein LTR08_004383 [Meristemomyces frigidus]